MFTNTSWNIIIRHSPPGMPYILLWFVRIIYVLFFRRQGFQMIIFDRQARQFQNFNRSQVMVKGSVSFSNPARPPGWGRGAPQTPQNPPQEHFKKKKICWEFFIFYCVLRPQEHFLAKTFFQLLKTSGGHFVKNKFKN